MVESVNIARTQVEIGTGKEDEEIVTGERIHFKYTTVTGFFLQSEVETDPADFEFMQTNFGLIEREYDTDVKLPDRGRGLTSWQRFEHKLAVMNAGAGPDVSYRLLFLGRHGNGYHNVAEQYYGVEAWDCHYSVLDGDPNGTMIWSDAHLTHEGVRQAREVKAFWRSQIDEQKMATPQSFYVSPLDRTLRTAEETFADLDLGDPDRASQSNDDDKDRRRAYLPVVKELLRETMGIHTCDRRSTKSYIREHYPSYAIETSLTEADELWLPDRRETNPVLTARLRRLLDDVVVHDSSTWISMTAHSGAIGALLRAVGHRPFQLQTGAVIPVLVRVEKASETDGSGSGSGKTTDHQAVNDDEGRQDEWHTKPECRHDLDLGNIGWQRWGKGLKEFLEEIEGR